MTRAKGLNCPFCDVLLRYEARWEHDFNKCRDKYLHGNDENDMVSQDDIDAILDYDDDTNPSIWAEAVQEQKTETISRMADCERRIKRLEALAVAAHGRRG